MNIGSRSLGRLFLQLRRLERQPRNFGNAGSITPSEIHTIEGICYEGAFLMNELAALRIHGIFRQGGSSMVKIF